MSAPSSRRDRGEAAAQLVIVIPVVVLLLMIGIQAAVWFHAAHVASAAAASGAAAGSTLQGSTGSAAAAATAMAGDLHATLIGAPRASRSDSRSIVTVTVQVPVVAPFFPRRVSRTAVEPVERFRPETER